MEKYRICNGICIITPFGVFILVCEIAQSTLSPQYRVNLGDGHLFLRLIYEPNLANQPKPFVMKSFEAVRSDRV